MVYDRKVNEANSQITEELLSVLSEEYREVFFDMIEHVPFIRNLIAKDRKKAKDLPKDDKGRIIVDICNPHILEDMDYFRPAAIFFEKHGCYTKLKPNSNPNSDFRKWLDEEVRRILEGYVRPDGEWVTGLMYFYMNYCPIMVHKKDKSGKKLNRMEGFPDCWDSAYLITHYLDQALEGGIYNDFKGNEHAGLIAKRGLGKSYLLSAILSRLFKVGKDSEVTKDTLGTIVANGKTYLQNVNSGTLPKYTNIIDFLDIHMHFPRLRIKSSLSDMQWQLGYKKSGSDVLYGTRNATLGLSITDDPDKVRGNRSMALLYEEFGTIDNFLTALNTSRYNVEDGDYLFGQIFFLGTGGTKGNSFIGAQEVIYHPKGYKVYSLPNVFDKEGKGKGESILFMGAYMSRKGCIDENGNSDVIKALVQVLKERQTTKQNSSDPSTIAQKVAELPLTIQEAILTAERNKFPVKDISQALRDLLESDILNNTYNADLVFDKQKVICVPSSESPIIYFPHKTNKLVGCPQIFEMPQKDSKGIIPSGRYIIGNDPVDDDESETLSLMSSFVLDLWTDIIVAEYTGRPSTTNEYYENLRKLALFYNATIMYENNKKGLYAYMSMMNCVYLLADTPDYLKEKDYTKTSTNNTTKGYYASQPVKSYGMRLINQWLLKPYTEIIEGIEITKPLLYKQPSIPLFQELSLWNPDGNYDRVSALIGLMLYREQKLMVLRGKDPSSMYNDDSNSIMKDDFIIKTLNKMNRKQSLGYLDGMNYLQLMNR